MEKDEKMRLQCIKQANIKYKQISLWLTAALALAILFACQSRQVLSGSFGRQDGGRHIGVSRLCAYLRQAGHLRLYRYLRPFLCRTSRVRLYLLCTGREKEPTLLNGSETNKINKQSKN